MAGYGNTKPGNRAAPGLLLSKEWSASMDQNHKPKKFSKEECVLAMKLAADSLGQFFTSKEYAEWQKEGRPDFPTHAQISRRCGSWNKAKEGAELFPNTVKRKACYKCGGVDNPDCPDCKQRMKNRKWAYKKYDTQRTFGICQCGNAPMPGRKSCAECLLKSAKRRYINSKELTPWQKMRYELQIKRLERYLNQDPRS